MFQEGNVLAVACLDGALKFFQLSGQQKSKDRELGYDPLTLAYFSHGEYMVVGGTDKSVSLYTKDGVLLTQVRRGGGACRLGDVGVGWGLAGVGWGREGGNGAADAGAGGGVQLTGV